MTKSTKIFLTTIAAAALLFWAGYQHGQMASQERTPIARVRHTLTGYEYDIYNWIEACEECVAFKMYDQAQ